MLWEMLGAYCPALKNLTIFHQNQIKANNLHAKTKNTDSSTLIKNGSHFQLPILKPFEKCNFSDFKDWDRDFYFE